MKKLVSMLTAFLLVLGFANVGYADDDKNCDDFSTQEEAQQYFDNHDPDADPSDLDRDDDGQACDSLPSSGEDTNSDSSNDSEEAMSNDDNSSSDEDMTSTEDSSSDADENTEGAEMAETATSYPIYMLLGFAIAAFGSLLLLKRRVHS